MPTVYVTSLGCRLNQAEMQALERRLLTLGYQLASEPEGADAIVINTCAVTREAERKSRQVLRRLERANPGARLVVTGCYAELDGGAAGSQTVVVGNEDKSELIEASERYLAPVAEVGSAASAGRRTRTRAFLRIEDGCDNRCSYCVVWQLRGPQRSRPEVEVLAEARALLSEGYRELVLTGVHIGAYGLDRDGHHGLSRLVVSLLGLPGLCRLRLSSLEPWDLAALDLSLWQDERLCPHLHVPLQSGSDAVLARMARRYSTAEYTALVERLRAAMPDLSLTTDIIVGFPGEGHEDFAASLDLARRCAFSKLHVFPYSQRPGTAAAAMPDQVEEQEKRRRAQQMRALGVELAHDYEGRFVGRTLEVLWEQRRGQVWTGLSANYLRLCCESSRDLRNQILPALLLGRDERGLVAKLGET